MRLHTCSDLKPVTGDIDECNNGISQTYIYPNMHVLCVCAPTRSACFEN